MFILQTQNETFGPFVAIAETDDSYLCDGGVYGKEIVGLGTIQEVAEDWESATNFATRLAKAKVDAVALINRRAGETRAKYMTDIPGQESTYLMKETEARAWTAAVDPVDIDYPILLAESLACGWTMQYTVGYVLATATAFRQLAAAIEGIRRGAIVTIEAATVISVIDAAKAVTWP